MKSFSIFTATDSRDNDYGEDVIVCSNTWETRMVDLGTKHKNQQCTPSSQSLTVFFKPLSEIFYIGNVYLSNMP